MSEEKEKFAGSIRQLIPVNEFSPQIQNEFINKSVLLEIRKRKFIFNQGDRDEFSFYLLDGDIEFYADKRLQSEIKGGTDRAKYAMAQLQPRQFSARAKTNCTILRIRRDSVDQLHVLQGESSTNNEDMEEGADVDITTVDFSEDEGVDWMTRMFQSELFSRLPTANIHGLFALLTPLELKAGDVVFNQGDPGECYYIVQEGQCQVSRKPPSGGKDVNLAVLKPGDSFGEESLITDTPRNATVSMLTDGIIMELSKDDFINLIKKPVLHSVSYGEATALVETGSHRWLDVRFKKEHEDSSIPGSLNIPLNMLRMEMENLDRETGYIVYCDTGGRSSTGAFLLTEGGYNACYLEGGLVNCPQAAKPSDVAPIKERKQPPPEEQKKKATVEKRAAKVAEDEELDLDVKSSILETELARTNIKLEDLEKNKLEGKNFSEQEVQKEVERRLKEERAKIEEAKKAAEQEARKLREVEEAKIKKMQEEAAKRLEAEKKRLEKVYSRNAEEMEKLQKMKEEAENKLNAEKVRLEKQAEESRKKLEDAERLKKDLEQSKQSLEGESMQSKKEREEVELKLKEAERLKQELEKSKQLFEEETKKRIHEQQEETERLKKELEQSKQTLEGESIQSKKEREEAQLKLQEAERLKQELEKSKQLLEEETKKKLQEQQEEARKKIEEAEKIKKDLEQARHKLESDALRKQKEQEEMEEKIQAKAREKLEIERRKLAEEYARSQEELEQARKERAAAEAARRAAKEEAAKIIEEFKQKHAEDKAKEEERIKIERMKLEEEQRKIQQSMEEIQKARQDAEKERQRAIREVEELKLKQEQQKAVQDSATQAALAKELKDAEDKISKANREIEKAEKAAIKADEAVKLNKEDLMKQLVIEDEVKKQLAEDLEDFRKEQETKEESVVDVASQMEHMKRIRMKAEEAKKAANQATADLLSDIESQLGSGEG